jgi:heme-degrading monooxygenase HmoA
MYAAIRQFKARPGSADALAEKIKEAISLISDVSGFMGYYVIYAPDDTVTAISVFNTVAEAQESNRRALAFIEDNRAAGHWARERDRRAGDRALAAVRTGRLCWPVRPAADQLKRARPGVRRLTLAPEC